MAFCEALRRFDSQWRRQRNLWRLGVNTRSGTLWLLEGKLLLELVWLNRSWRNVENVVIEFRRFLVPYAYWGIPMLLHSES